MGRRSLQQFSFCRCGAGLWPAGLRRLRLCAGPETPATGRPGGLPYNCDQNELLRSVAGQRLPAKREQLEASSPFGQALFQKLSVACK